MKHLLVFDDWRIYALLGIMLIAVVLLICDTNSAFWFMATKFAGIALIYIYGKLFARWEPKIFDKDEQQET